MKQGELIPRKRCARCGRTRAYRYRAGLCVYRKWADQADDEAGKEDTQRGCFVEFERWRLAQPQFQRPAGWNKKSLTLASWGAFSDEELAVIADEWMGSLMPWEKQTKKWDRGRREMIFGLVANTGSKDIKVTSADGLTTTVVPPGHALNTITGDVVLLLPDVASSAKN